MSWQDHFDDADPTDTHAAREALAAERARSSEQVRIRLVDRLSDIGIHVERDRQRAASKLLPERATR